MPTASPLTKSSSVPNIKFRQVVGAVAGNMSVLGIRPTDQLLYVGGWTLTEGTPNVPAALGDLTSQFTITANDTINNTGGTSSAGGMVLVAWAQSPPGL